MYVSYQKIQSVTNSSFPNERSYKAVVFDLARRRGLGGRVRDSHPSFAPLVAVIVVVPSLAADVLLPLSPVSLSGVSDSGPAFLPALRAVIRAQETGACHKRIHTKNSS